MELKILLIEDDLILAEGLVENLYELGYRNVKVASGYQQVEDVLQSFVPDIFIVDIYLKGSPKNGIEIMEHLDASKYGPIIYLTSFDDHLYRDKAKKTNPSAYLIKPASKQQVDVAIDFAISNFSESKIADNSGIDELTDAINLRVGQGYFFVKTGDRYEKVAESDVLYLQASGTYTLIYTNQKTYTVATNIKRLLPQVNQNIFVRCHRSYAINKNKIVAFNETDLFIQGEKEMSSIPVSRSFKSELTSSLVRIKTE